MLVSAPPLVLDANNYGYSSHPQRQRYDSSRDETFAGQPSYNYGPSPPRSAPNHAPPRQTGQRARQRPNDNCVRVSSLRPSPFLRLAAVSDPRLFPKMEFG